MNNPCAADDGTYVVVPWLVLVVDDGGAEAPGGVDAGAGDGDGGQVEQKPGPPVGVRPQHLGGQKKTQIHLVFFFSHKQKR